MIDTYVEYALQLSSWLSYLAIGAIIGGLLLLAIGYLAPEDDKSRRLSTIAIGIVVTLINVTYMWMTESLDWIIALPVVGLWASLVAALIAPQKIKRVGGFAILAGVVLIAIALIIFALLLILF